MLVAQHCIKTGMSKSLVLAVCRISRSSFYYKARNGKAGRPRPGLTRTLLGLWVSDWKVIEDIVELLAGEFVDYGYYKTTVHLRDEKGYVINPKKVYRLMKESNLLLPNRQSFATVKRQWVKELVPDPQTEFTYFEFDIKYIYVQGKRANAQVLTVLDVFSRWNMGQIVKWNIRQGDVVALFDGIFEQYELPERFCVRNDNGSQFVAETVQKYFQVRKVIQEFTKPATPEQNAHIESYHSVMERAVCKRHEFDSLTQAAQTLDRFREFYNFRRIHSGVGYKSPYRFLLGRGVDMKKKYSKSKNVPTKHLEILS